MPGSSPPGVLIPGIEGGAGDGTVEVPPNVNNPCGGPVYERTLKALPPTLSREPFVLRAYCAMANEVQYGLAVAEAIRVGLTPATATDTYKGLSMLETQLGLAIAPAGLTDDQRRGIALAWIKARRGGTGAAWVSLMTLTFGNAPWSYQEGPGDSEITILIPFEEGSLTAFQAMTIARAITPAHLDVIPTHGGFLIGISEIGVEPL